MSAVRFFDDTPHIVRYGMHDDKTEKCWVIFWRNGVKFTIRVEKEDVQGTPFHTEWVPLLRERSRGEMPLSQWVEQQWHPLCDLLITTSMPTLRQLAPKQDYWVTIRDYVHTPAYKLRLKASKDQVSIETVIEEGPTDSGAYELSPVPMETFSPPPHLQCYQSSQLHVLGREKNWRQRPSKVVLPDGRQVFFLGSERGSRNANTKQLSNTPVDAIRAQLRISELGATISTGDWPSPLPRVCGLVTDEPPSENQTGMLQEGRQQTGHETREQRIAGILLTWIPHGKKLATIAQDSSASQGPDLIKISSRWKEAIEQALAFLHNHGVFVGGRPDWSYTNQYSVLIDDSNQAWLNVSQLCSASGVGPEDAQAGMAMDVTAVASLFDKWLPDELVRKYGN